MMKSSNSYGPLRHLHSFHPLRILLLLLFPLLLALLTAPCSLARSSGIDSPASEGPSHSGVGEEIISPRIVFEQHPALVQGRSGQSVVLDCEAGGSPTPIIYWTRHGEKIQQGTAVRDVEAQINDVLIDVNNDDNNDNNNNRPSLRVGSTRSRLYLDCLRPENAGEYVCVASIPQKIIKTTTRLNIDSNGTYSSCARKRFGPTQSIGARIYMWTSNRLEFEGSDVLLFCRADGSPKPNVHWFDQQDRPITNNEQYQIMSSGDLLIKSATWSDNMGTYRCLAQNDVGSDQVSTFLYPTLP